MPNVFKQPVILEDDHTAHAPLLPGHQIPVDAVPLDTLNKSNLIKKTSDGLLLTAKMLISEKLPNALSVGTDGGLVASGGGGTGDPLDLISSDLPNMLIPGSDGKLLVPPFSGGGIADAPDNKLYGRTVGQWLEIKIIDPTTGMLRVDPMDQTVTQSANGVRVHVALRMEPGGVLQLVGKGAAGSEQVISAVSIPLYEFVDDVDIVDDPAGQPAGRYLKVVFRLTDGTTDTEYIPLDVLSGDVYTAGNAMIDIQDHEIFGRADADAGLTVGASGVTFAPGFVAMTDAERVKLSGLEPAQDYTAGNPAVAVDNVSHTISGVVDTAKHLVIGQSGVTVQSGYAIPDEVPADGAAYMRTRAAGAAEGTWAEYTPLPPGGTGMTSVNSVTVYVNSVSGDDTYTGLTAAQAFKTIRKVLEYINGLKASGSVAAANIVRIYASGSFSDLTIDASNFMGGSVVQTGSTVYERTMRIDGPATFSNIHIRGGNVALTNVTTTSVLEVFPGANVCLGGTITVGSRGVLVNPGGVLHVHSQGTTTIRTSGSTVTSVLYVKPEGKAYFGNSTAFTAPTAITLQTAFLQVDAGGEVVFTVAPTKSGTFTGKKFALAGDARVTLPGDVPMAYLNTYMPGSIDGVFTDQAITTIVGGKVLITDPIDAEQIANKRYVDSAVLESSSVSPYPEKTTITVFIDSVNGNDTNDGTASTKALKTTTEMMKRVNSICINSTSSDVFTFNITFYNGTFGVTTLDFSTIYGQAFYARSGGTYQANNRGFYPGVVASGVLHPTSRITTRITIYTGVVFTALAINGGGRYITIAGNSTATYVVNELSLVDGVFDVNGGIIGGAIYLSQLATMRIWRATCGGLFIGSGSIGYVYPQGTSTAADLTITGGAKFGKVLNESTLNTTAILVCPGGKFLAAPKHFVAGGLTTVETSRIAVSGNGNYFLYVGNGGEAHLGNCVFSGTYTGQRFVLCPGGIITSATTGGVTALNMQLPGTVNGVVEAGSYVVGGSVNV